jgi:predicted HAD superfamily phosphohydrolase YqeG
MDTERGNASRSTLKALDVRGIKDATVIIDIDGTIAADRQVECSTEMLAVIRFLASRNAVYLLSNHRDSIRNRAVVRRTGLACIETPHRKPSRKVLDSLPAQHRGRPIVVIGDKAMIDGLFAWRIGARFIKVARIVSPADGSIVRLSCCLDDLSSKIGHWVGLSCAREAARSTDSICPQEESSPT